MRLSDIRTFLSEWYLRAKSDRRVLAPTVAFLILAVSLLGYFGYRLVSEYFAVPEVLGANFSTEYRRIPYNAKSIDVTFSTSLDATSITRESVTLSPDMSGSVSLVGGNTVSYGLSAPLTIGETYTLTLRSSIRSRSGNGLAEDKIFTFRAIEAAHATKILPSGRLENLSQNIVVLFSTPVVEMTNLDNRDRLPCPLTITPKVAGKCKWTNGNVLEFIPDRPLEVATRYKLRVADIPGLLYPLEKPLDAEILTPDLIVSVFTGSAFSPREGIRISTNAPVKPDDLARSIDLQEGNIKLEEVITPVKDEDGKESETNFTLTAKNHPYLYVTAYSLTVAKGLKSKYGTEPLSQDMSTPLQSGNFLVGVTPYRNILDASGAVSDTKDYSSTPYIPSDRVFFRAEFAEEMALDMKLFALSDEKGKNIPVSLKYVSESTYGEHGEATGAKENKYKIDVTPTGALSPGVEYTLTIRKDANPSMPRDELKIYTTAPKLTVSDFRPMNNTEICISVNNELFSPGFGTTFSSEYLHIDTVPTSWVHDLAKDGTTDWSTGKATYRCGELKNRTGYIIGMRPNPNTNYQVKFTTAFEDIYGQKLEKEAVFPFRSGPIAEIDKYLYSSLNREVQVIPSTLPITLNMQSVNIDRANLEICEMETEGYLHYLSFGWDTGYKPLCKTDTLTGVVLKNRYWNLTPNRFDLEKEVLGRSFSTPFVFVRGSTAGFNQGNNWYRKDGREFAHVFVRTNLSMTLEDAGNKKILFITSVDGKSIPSDLAFETYARKAGGWYERINSQIVFDAKKQVYEIVSSDKSIDLISAKNASSMGVLNKGQDQVSNYDFKYIAGQDSSTRDYLYAYSDRPLYKAGDSVYFKGLLRTFNFDGYRPSSVKIGKIQIVGEAGGYDTPGSILYETGVSIDANANFNGRFDLPKNMPLGRYHFEFFAGADKIPVYNNGEFYVEAYKKPVFRVSVASPTPDSMIGKSVDLSASAEYYFGGRLANADYTYSVLAQNYYFNPRDYADYQFGRGSAFADCLYWGSCEYSDSLVTVGTGRLDSNGEARIHYDYPKSDDADHTLGERIYTYTVEATDPDTLRTVSNQASQILHTTDGYVGVRAAYWNEKSKGLKVAGVILGYDAKELSGKHATLELVHRDWKDIKKQGVDGTFYHETSVEEKIETTVKVTSDNKGEFSHTFSPNSVGEYEIRATYTGANGQSFLSSQSVYVAGEKNSYWSEGNNSVTDLIADKTILNIGDTAGFTLKSPVTSGKMLVTIEKDDGILDYFVRDITSSAPRIEFKILESHIPNVYVKVYLIGKDATGPLPIYKRALSVVKVTTDPKKLSVSIKTDKPHYQPREKIRITVAVKDAAGRPVAGANGSLSVVDESLLALAGNPKKNPFAFFYDMKRYLGIETYISLTNLIEKLEVKDTSLGEKWGAGEGQKWGNSRKKRGIFKDMAYWQSDFTTGRDGTYTVTTDELPDNLTTWNIESVVNTSDNRVGVSDTSIMTAQTVMINENLPRFLGAGDRVTLSPVVFNKTGKDANFDVSIDVSNASVQSAKKTVLIKSGGQTAVPFDLEIVDSNTLRSLSVPSAKITLRAVSSVTNESDEVENTLPIVATATTETVATVGKATATADERIRIPEAIRANGGSFTVTYAATLLPSILSGMKYLETFPYGCIEQKLSSIMPTVYLKGLYESAKLPFDLKSKTVPEYRDAIEGFRQVSIDSVIRNILLSARDYQRPDGGFGYWTDSERSYLPLTVETVSRLAEIRSIGYAIDATVLNQAISYLKSEFYKNRRPYCSAPSSNPHACEYSASERLSIVEAILDANTQDYEGYKMYKLVASDAREDVSAQVLRARIIAKLLRINALAPSDKDMLRADVNGLVNRIVNEGLVYNPRGAFIGRDTVSERLENTTGLLEAIALLGALTPTLSQGEREKNDQIIDSMQRWIISEKKSDGSFGSTADTTRVISSLVHTLRASGELRDINLRAKLSLDTVTLAEQSIDAKNKLESFSKTVDLAKLRDSSTLHIEKVGNGTVYYDLATTYSIPSRSVASRDEGFYIEQTWYDYDAYRNVEHLKREEWANYLSGSIGYRDLKYPKEVVEYLKPITDLTVGKLVYVYNRAIFGEPRDQVAFEGFIPSGSELVNPSLKTEDQSARFNTIFDHEEFRDDRYFATVSGLDAGVYTFGYVLRPTHAGTFEMLPSRMFEFYHPEVFGRTNGREVKVEK